MTKIHKISLMAPRPKWQNVHPDNFDLYMNGNLYSVLTLCNFWLLVELTFNMFLSSRFAAVQELKLYNIHRRNKNEGLGMNLLGLFEEVPLLIWLRWSVLSGMELVSLWLLKPLSLTNPAPVAEICLETDIFSFVIFIIHKIY